jgi:hypothetical protein
MSADPSLSEIVVRRNDDDHDDTFDDERFPSSNSHSGTDIPT